MAGEDLPREIDPETQIQDRAQSVASATVAAISKVNPIIAGLLDAVSSKILGDSKLAYEMGFMNMGAVHWIQSYPDLLVVGGLLIEKAGEIIKAFQAYFTLEKFSDDFGQLDESGRFKHGEMLIELNKLFIDILDGKATRAQREFHQRKFFKDLVVTDATRIVEKLSAKLDDWVVRGLRMSVPFFRDPNPLFLKANIVSARNLMRIMKADLEKHPEFSLLIKKGMSGLRERYVKMNALVGNPSMEIEEALKVGKGTILTDIFGYQIALLGIYAKADTQIELMGGGKVNTSEFRNWIISNQDTLCEAIDSHSYVIRLLNDGGELLTDAKQFDSVVEDLISFTGKREEEFSSAREMLISFDNAYEEKLRAVAADLGIDAANMDIESIARVINQIRDAEPQRLGTKTIEELAQLANLRARTSRLLKDAKEGEYNIFLNALDYDQQLGWRAQFRKNLLYGSQQFHFHTAQLANIINDPNNQTPEAKLALDFIVRFCLFNYEIYSQAEQDGQLPDYDRRFDPKMASLTKGYDDIVQSFMEKLVKDLREA